MNGKYLEWRKLECSEGLTLSFTYIYDTYTYMQIYFDYLSSLESYSFRQFREAECVVTWHH